MRKGVKMTRLLNNRPLMACVLLVGVLTASGAGAGPMPALEFDASRYQLRQVDVDGKTLAIRAYENIAYVTRPVDQAHQVMNLYIPDAYFQGQEVGRFNARTAPIFLPNQVGGYMPGEPGTLDGRRGPPGAGKGQRPPPGDGPGGPEQPRTSTIAAALARGFVVASPGARGRTSQAADGTWSGKAPAAIVDLKAAVRYLHFNDERMPGDAHKIIANGTSAGGALSALLGASGNNTDYQPYLDALGAAPAGDDIFAVSAYCPITNLDNADSAYEWLFAGINDYRKIDISMLDYKVQRKEVAGTLSKEQIDTSEALRQQFPAYLNSLALRDPGGQNLTLDASGNGPFKDYLKSLIIASANHALAAGTDLSALKWLTLRGGKVVDLDFDAYVRYAGRMKLPPAFDALDASSGENQLFGTQTLDARHFTAFAKAHDSNPATPLADALTVRMMNPMAYIATRGTDTARHWRIRQGTRDRDTSLAIPVILAAVLQNRGYSVDLALPWDRPHSGDYDLEELFAWMEGLMIKP